MDIRYHLSKANVVDDTLSRKVTLSQMTTSTKLQWDILHEQIEMVIGLLVRSNIKLTLLDEI